MFASRALIQKHECDLLFERPHQQRVLPTPHDEEEKRDVFALAHSVAVQVDPAGKKIDSLKGIQ